MSTSTAGNDDSDSDEELGDDNDKEAIGDVEDITNTGTTTGTDGTPTPSGDPISEAGSGSGLPIGAIVGGVIGGLALIIAVAFIIWYVRLQKRKLRQQQHQQHPPDRLESSYVYPRNGAVEKPNDCLPRSYAAEMPAYSTTGWHTAAELPGERWTAS